MRVTRGRGEPEQWIRAGTTQREANRVLATVQAELSRSNTPLPSPTSPVKFVDLAERWWREYAMVHLTANTRRAYRSEVDAVKEWFAGDRADAIGLAQLDEMVAALVEAGASPQTISHRTVRVRQILTWGHARGVVPSVPPRVKSPKVKRQREPMPLRPDELARLLDACEPPWRAFFATVAFHGLRPGEAKALSWPDIGHGRLWVRLAIDSMGEEHEPKASSARVLPLDPIAAALLAELPQTSERIFPGLDLVAANRELRAALDRAGVPAEGRILYDLRHTYATLAILLGVSPATLARRMGNSVKIAMGTYVAWWEDLAPDADVVVSGALPSGNGRGGWPQEIPDEWKPPANGAIGEAQTQAEVSATGRKPSRPRFRPGRPGRRVLPAPIEKRPLPG